MLLKRLIPLFTIVFFLTGCFREAADTFDTVGSSQDSVAIGITQEPDSSESATPTTEVSFIDPNATEIEAETVEEDATATPRTISPTQEEAAAPSDEPLTIPTATEVVASATPITLPTATEPVFITPEVIQEVELASPTPRSDADTPTLEPSPTVFDTSVELGDCDYEVQDGDNLFRISINNDVDLEELLRANGLSQGSIIQPGQILTLPNCAGESLTGAEEEEVAAPTAIVLDDCEYEIQTGDTLFAISLEFDVTLAELLEENDLPEDTVIQPGQIIDIPNCVDADGENNVVPAESTEEASNETEEIIHIVATGDTLQSISLEYGVSVNAIVQINTIPDLNNLTVGQQITIPNDDE